MILTSNIKYFTEIEFLEVRKATFAKNFNSQFGEFILSNIELF